MADVLDQSAVDNTLLPAGAVRTEEPTDGKVDGSIPSDRGEVSPYDFTSPKQLDKEWVAILEDIHKGFARRFAASLSDLLHSVVEVRVAAIEQATYGEFIHSLPNPTCFNLFKAALWPGRFCLDISPLIVYPIIDCLLGGANADLFIPQRPLTDIEWRLVGRITDRVTENLSASWPDGQELGFELTERESNAHLLPIVAPDEKVVVVSIELKMGTRMGAMSFCFPLAVLEPVLGDLEKGGGGAGRGQSSGSQREQIETNLKSADVDVCAYLAGATITLNDLLRLQPGDIVQTTKPSDSDLILRVGRRNKFAGKLYKHKGLRAIRITRRAEPNESL